VREKQALRDSSLDTKPPCFAVGGADNDNIDYSYMAFVVAVLRLKRCCCDLFFPICVGLHTSTNSGNKVHQHRRIGRVGKEDFVDGDFKLPCSFSENLRASARSQNQELSQELVS